MRIVPSTLAAAERALQPSLPVARRSPAACLFLLQDAHDVAEVRAANSGEGVQDFAQLESHALTLLTRRSYDVVVWEPVSMDAGFMSRALECCERSPGTTFVLRGSLAVGLVRLVRTIAPTSAKIRLSLRPLPIVTDLFDVLAGSGVVADIPIIAGLSRLWPESAFPELIALVSCGSRRVGPVATAGACGCALRTLQWRLRTAGLPPASTLLGWMVTLHTMWRLEVLGWSLKRAASVAGMPDGRNLSEYVARHASARPRALLHKGGFHATVARLCEVLSTR